jgi:hypothetical protein
MSALSLSGCAAGPWPEVPSGAGSSSAQDRLRDSAAAHGLTALAALHDVNFGFSGLWSPVAGLSLPAQARWLPGSGLVALSPWPTTATEPAASSWLGDLHRLLWLGPMAVADASGAVQWAEPETLDGLRCDHLHLPLLPGLGGAAVDRLSLFIDRDQGWLRRLRVSINEQGAGTWAEVDLAGHRRSHGVLWPTTYRARKPVAAAWQLTALDVNRGYGRDAIAGAAWSAAAAAPARPLQPGT